MLYCLKLRWSTILGIKVNIRRGESLEKALRKFKKRCEKEGLVKELRKNEYYEKPSERKRRDRKRLIKKLEKERQEEAARYEK